MCNFQFNLYSNATPPPASNYTASTLNHSRPRVCVVVAWRKNAIYHRTAAEHRNFHVAWRGVSRLWFSTNFPPRRRRAEHEDALLAPTAPSSLGESMLKMARERAYVKNLSLLCVCVVRVVWEWIFSFHPSCIIQQPGLGKSIRWGDFIVENSVCQWRDGAMVRG